MRPYDPLHLLPPPVIGAVQTLKHRLPELHWDKKVHKVPSRRNGSSVENCLWFFHNGVRVAGLIFAQGEYPFFVRSGDGSPDYDCPAYSFSEVKTVFAKYADLDPHGN